MSATGKAAQIPDALLAHFLTLSIGSPALPLAHPDAGFDPETDAPDGKYIEAGYQRTAAAWEGLSSGVIDQGLFTIGVVWPPRKGVIVPNDIAQEVADHFPKLLQLKSGSTNVRIVAEPTIGSPIIERDKTIVPVSIRWQA